MGALHDQLAAELLGRPDLKAKKRGGKVEFRCLRHDDKTPSAWMKEGSHGCFACGFTEPITTLATELGVVLEGGSSGYTVEVYADEKSFPVSRLLDWGVETAEVKGYPAVVIPYFGQDGKLLRRRFRGHGGKKWWEGRDRPIHLYGLDRLPDLTDGAPLLIVEGESDCHAAWLHDFDAVGVPGSTTWKSEWVEHVAGHEIYVWEEPDDAGAHFTMRVAADLPKARVIHAADAQVKDLADLHRKSPDGFAQTLRALMAEATPVGIPKPPEPIDALLGATFDHLLEKKLRPVDAVPTPFPAWNAVCAGEGGRVGLARGWYVVVGAKTGKGKSLLAVNLGARAIAAGERVTFISLEMDQDEVNTRLMAIASDESIASLEQGPRFDTSAFGRARARIEATHRQSGGCFFCNRRQFHGPEAVMAAIRYQHEVRGSRFFFVDYLQLAGNAYDAEGIANVSHAVRRVTKELDIVTVGLSQFHRVGSMSSEPPGVDALMGGVALANDADQVLLLDHSKMEKVAAPLTGWTTRMLLEKNRHGPSTEIPIRLDGKTLKIRETWPDEERSRGVA